MEKDEINLLDYWVIAKKRKWALITIVIAVTFLGSIWAVVQEDTYKVDATLLPVTSLGGSDAAGSFLKDRLGSLSGMMGSLSDSLNSPSKILIAILTSKALAQRVLERENLFERVAPLAKLPGASKLSDAQRLTLQRETAIQWLKAQIKFEEDKKIPVLRLEVVTGEPALGFRIVQAYIEELQSYLNNNSLTLAKRNRIFTETRLADSQANLLESGKSLANFYQGNRISSSSSTLDVLISPRGDRVVDRSNPNLLADKNIGKVVKDVPQKVYLEHVLSQKEVLSRAAALLSTQLELAKTEEGKDSLAFQVIDQPYEPVLKYGPRRKLIMILSLFSSLLLAVCYMTFMEYVDRLRRTQSLG